VPKATKEFRGVDRHCFGRTAKQGVYQRSKKALFTESEFFGPVALNSTPEGLRTYRSLDRIKGVRGARRLWAAKVDEANRQPEVTNGVTTASTAHQLGVHVTRGRHFKTPVTLQF